MRIGIKVGSSLLTKKGNGINYPFMVDLCQQIAKLTAIGQEIFLVTSGAIRSDPHATRSGNLRAAVGMPRLMAKYIEYLGIYGLEAAQMLLVDWDFEKNSAFIKTVIEEALAQGVVPIFNANDVVSNEEIRNLSELADNDHLFLRLCQLLYPGMAIMGIDQPAISDNDGHVRVINRQNYDQLYEYVSGGNAHRAGQDGAKVKLAVGRQIAEMGIKFSLAPGHEPNFLVRAVNNLRTYDNSGDVILGDNCHNFGTVFVFNH